MIRIVATDEQMRQLKNAREGIEFVDDSGNRIGILALEVDLEDIRVARERLKSNQPRLSYAEVLEHVHVLERS
jgi:hypothetical protein